MLWLFHSKVNKDQQHKWHCIRQIKSSASYGSHLCGNNNIRYNRSNNKRNLLFHNDASLSPLLPILII